MVGTNNKARVELFGIYALLDPGSGRDIEVLHNDILHAGVRIVQYRSKQGVDRDLLRRLCTRARAFDAFVIVNDDLDAAIEADGVHIGQEDLQMLDAANLRKRLGNRLLGISCATPEEAYEAERIGADYIGVGPFKQTASKHDAGPAIGAEGIARVVQSTHLPIAAIGGIELNDLDEIVRSGAKMAAIISAIASAEQPQTAAQALVQRWTFLTR